MTGGRYALIIANFHYDDPGLSKLISPPQDAENLARVLADSQVGGFTVKPLLNEYWHVVRREIHDFFKEKKPDDLLLLYFSGHGIKDEEGHLYYAFPDTELKKVQATAIEADFINSMMQRSRSRRQVVILDCCYSGAFARGMTKADKSISTGESFKGKGKVVLTASDDMQYAFEEEEVLGEGVSSVFTRYLIEGLKTGAADANGDGEISLDELYDYVYDQVKRNRPEQSPQKWDFGLEGNICIACNPTPVIKPANLPSELLESIEDLRHWVREGAARALKELLFGSDKPMELAAFEALKRMEDDDSFKVRCLVGKILEEYDAKQPPEVVIKKEQIDFEKETPSPGKVEDKPESLCELRKQETFETPPALQESTALTPSATSMSQEIQWRNNWTEAMEEAKKANLPLALVFYLER